MNRGWSNVEEGTPGVLGLGEKGRHGVRRSERVCRDQSAAQRGR